MGLKSLHSLLFLLLFIPSCLFGQDIIQLINGQRLFVKVVEVSPLFVRYKISESGNAPVGMMKTKQIFKITFENDSTVILSQVMKRTIGSESLDDLSQFNLYKGHSLGINVFNFVYGNLSLNYDWIHKNSRFGLRVPITIGLVNLFDSDNYLYLFKPYNDIGIVGLEFRIFQRRLSLLRHVYGPALGVGTLSRGGSVRLFYTFYFNNGFVFDYKRHLRFGADIGVGLQTNFNAKKWNFDEWNHPILNLNIHLGYRF